MAIGTTRHLPLGITTDDRRGPIRRRRTFITIGAMCTVAIVGFAIAEKAHELLAAKPAYAPRAESNPIARRTPAEGPAATAMTEAPRPAAEAGRVGHTGTGIAQRRRNEG